MGLLVIRTSSLVKRPFKSYARFLKWVFCLLLEKGERSWRTHTSLQNYGKPTGKKTDTQSNGIE